MKKSSFLTTALVLLLAISVSINLILLFRKPDKYIDPDDMVDPLFLLADPTSEYVLVKEPTGTYSIKHIKDGETKSALVGSSQLPLDSFDQKKVEIVGSFRKIFGIPICYKKCEGNYRAPVIDIRDVTVIE